MLLSIGLAARSAGFRRLDIVNLAVTHNARGGPGIVLASVAFDAGIISATFFTTLVLTAVLTSQACGVWLDFVLRKGWPLLASEVRWSLEDRSSSPHRTPAARSAPTVGRIPVEGTNALTDARLVGGDVRRVRLRTPSESVRSGVGDSRPLGVPRHLAVDAGPQVRLRLPAEHLGCEPGQARGGADVAAAAAGRR